MAARSRCPRQVSNGTELGTPGDEYNKSPWREGSPRLLSEFCF